MDAHPPAEPALPDPGLAEIEAQLWQALEQAAQTRGHAWRTMALATVDADGLPDVRSVVLREVDRAQREILFYTDARSPKVAQMQQQPRGRLLMWSADLGWQLRISVQLAVETSGLAVSSRWARLQMSPAAQDYLSPLPPGSVLAAQAMPARSRVHFAVVTAQMLAIDWLSLQAPGHRRARFDADGSACWLQP